MFNIFSNWFGRKRHARNVRLTGPRARAKVIEVKRSKSSNAHAFYDVILRFTDSQGHEHEHRTMTMTHRPYVGSKHWIRFDPKKPGRKSTRFVEWE